MGRSTEYKHGINEGVRWAITWLHARAYTMNDPKARQILNSAAFGLGVELNRTGVVPRKIGGEHERARVGRDWRTLSAQIERHEPTSAVNKTQYKRGTERD